MIKVKQPKIMNSKGDAEITLTPREKAHCAYMQKLVNERFCNDIGYEVNITTLTQVIKKVSESKHFEIFPSEYFPVKVGEGAWSTSLTTFRSFDVAGEFETGIINTSGQHGRLASANAAIDALNIRVFPWAKSIDWTIFELEEASRSGNWDIVAAKEKSRKRNWDLGIQRVAFLGLRGQNGAGGQALGLLGQQGAVTTNTTLITKPIKTMTPTELKTFMAALIEEYRKNTNRTAWPDRFVIPESDYNGLAAQSSPDFPIKSTLAVLEEGFKLVTKKDFKILPLPYGDSAYNDFGYNIYALYSSDEESIRMDIPLQYQNTVANSLDNFHFQNAGYGQFTGVLAYRNHELMYFTYP